MNLHPIQLILVSVLAAVSMESAAAELRIGTATINLTPDKPVALAGQFNTRISRGVDNPITATPVAVESREGGRSVDQEILLSSDIVVFFASIPQPLHERLRAKLPEFDTRKLVMTATHAHTAPVTEEGTYDIPKEGVMHPRAYAEFLAGRLAEVCTRAWNQRQPGGVSWGLGQAVAGIQPACGVRRRARAGAGGGCSAVIQSNMVGPEGGQLLMDRTVKLINGLWPQPK